MMTTLVAKVTLVLLAAFLLELVFRKASASVRHFLWSLAAFSCSPRSPGPRAAGTVPEFRYHSPSSPHRVRS